MKRFQVSGFQFRVFRWGLLAFLVATCDCFAASGGEGSAQFLTLNGGARAAAMGGAYTAAGDDAGSLFYNPAGLAEASGTQGQLLYQRWIAGMNLSTLALSRELPGLGTLAGGLMYLGTPSTESFDAAGLSSGTFTSSDLALSLAGARRFGRILTAGLNARFVQEKLAASSASGASADLGLKLSWPSGIHAGISASGLGSGLKHISQASSQASRVRLGLAGRLADRRLLLSLDLAKPMDDDPEIRLGTEFALAPRAWLRAGYALEMGGTGIPGFTGLSAGLGFQAGPLLLDYALSPMGDLGLTHFVGLGFRSASAASPKPASTSAPASPAPASTPAETKKMDTTKVVELLRQRNPDGALRILTGLSKQSPRDPILFFYTGSALRQKGDKEKALKYFEAALKLSHEGSKLHAQIQAQIKALGKR